jgi:deferrochelatase/peroxidase EfeB
MSSVNRRTVLKTLGLGAAVAATSAVGFKVGESSSQSASNLTPAGGNNTLQVASLFPFEGIRQAGIITPPPEAVLLVALDITTNDRNELVRLFQQITLRTRALMNGKLGDSGESSPDYPPTDNTGELGFDNLNDGHLSIMVGMGASLFELEGKDRFGLAAQKPLALTAMPHDLHGDRLDPTQIHGDLLLQISSDHALYNMHTLRDILRHTKGQLTSRWVQPGFQRFFQAPTGHATARGLLGFKDGTANLDVKDAQLMEQVVWAGSEEPYWAQGGTYIAVRKIREQIERWDRLTLNHQETAIGRTKRDGITLDNASSSSDSTQETKLPDYASDPNGTKMPLNSHIRKANPRQGAETDKRRMLRRGYLYFNGIDKAGLLDAGFLFMGFCRNVQEQFEFVKRNYMTNPNYPQANTGKQDLDEYMFAVGGGYFFVPPGVKEQSVSWAMLYY